MPKYGPDVSAWSSELKPSHARTLLAECKKSNVSKYLPPIHYAKCIGVYDGDTITVAAPLYPGVLNSFSLRLDGYDSPEMRTKNKGEKEIAIIARDKLKELLTGALLRVDVKKYDKYGRPLADVYIQSYDDGHAPLEISVNQWMLQHRLGIAYDGGTKLKVNWPLFYHEGKLRERNLKRFISKKKMTEVSRSAFVR